MKIPVKKLFPILLASLGLVFAIMVYFVGTHGTGKGFLGETGESLYDSTEDEIINGVLENAQTGNGIEIPVITYIGGSRTVGDVVDYRTLFQFEYQDGRTVQGTEESVLVIYLKDVLDGSEKSVCEKLLTEDIESMEEISSAFVLDQDTKQLYFYKSGVYKLLVKVYYDKNQYVNYECMIPVEVR